MRDVARESSWHHRGLSGFHKPSKLHHTERPLENFRGAAFQTLNSSPAEPVLVVLPIPTLGAHAHASLILHLGVKRAKGIIRQSHQRRLWKLVSACLSTYTDDENLFRSGLGSTCYLLLWRAYMS